MRARTAKQEVEARFLKYPLLELRDFMSRKKINFADLYFWQPPKFYLSVKNDNFDQPEEYMYFGEGHADALIYLVEEKGLDFDNALTEISMLFNDQAKALIKLYDYGLRRENLRRMRCFFELDKNPLCDLERVNRVYYTEDHTNALLSLLTDANKPLDLNDALYQIYNLNAAQAKALGKLYKFGLRAEHLLAWKGPLFWFHHKPTEERFCFAEQHANALERFIMRDKLAPEKAIEIINGLMETSLRSSAAETEIQHRGAQDREREKIQWHQEYEKEKLANAQRLFKLSNDHIADKGTMTSNNLSGPTI